MAGLNDAIATQIMGEIDTVTRRIDTQGEKVEEQLNNQKIIARQISDAKEQFEVVIRHLVLQIDAMKLNQIKNINDQLALAMGQIEANTAAAIEVIAAAVHARTLEEINSIADSANNAREVAVTGVLTVIERKFNEALGSVAGANKSFDDAKTRFYGGVTDCLGMAKDAVSKYDKALETSASQHTQYGVGWFFMAALLAAAISATSVMFYVSHHDAKLAELGSKFQTVYRQLDPKTQEKINKLWQSNEN